MELITPDKIKANNMSSFTKVNENQNAENKHRKGEQLNHQPLCLSVKSKTQNLEYFQAKDHIINLTSKTITQLLACDSHPNKQQNLVRIISTLKELIASV